MRSIRRKLITLPPSYLKADVDRYSSARAILKHVPSTSKESLLPRSLAYPFFGTHNSYINPYVGISCLETMDLYKRSLLRHETSVSKWMKSRRATVHQGVSHKLTKSNTMNQAVKIVELLTRNSLI